MNDPVFPSPSAASGGSAKRRITLSMIAAGLLAPAYVGVIHYLDSRKTQICKGACTREDSYVLRFKSARQKKEKFWILNLRPGRILIEADQDIDSLNIVTTEESVIPAVKVTDRLFSRQLKYNLVIGSVRLVPHDNSLKSINIRISRKPVSSPLFAAYQISFFRTSCGGCRPCATFAALCRSIA